MVCEAGCPNVRACSLGFHGRLDERVIVRVSKRLVKSFPDGFDALGLQ